MDNIGDELRIRRQLKRLTQRQVSSSAGINKVWLSAIENGRIIPTPETAERIRNAIDRITKREVTGHVGRPKSLKKQ